MKNIEKIKNKIIGTALYVNNPHLYNLKFEIVNADYYNEIWHIKIFLKEYLHNFQINGENIYLDVVDIPSDEISYLYDYKIREQLNVKLKHFGIDTATYYLIK